MSQPPLAHFQEDREARVRHRESGRRTYLVALPVVGAVVAVALLGVLGSRMASDGKVRPSAPGNHAIVPSSASPANTVQWDRAVPPVVIDIPGFSTVPMTKGGSVTAGLPPDTLPFDADGGDFLYGSGQGLYVLAPEQTLFTPLQVGIARPCGQIEQASISGTRIIYSEIVPGGYSGDGNEGCPGFGGTVDWYVSITDYGGVANEVASGTCAVPPSSGLVSVAPSVAIADVAYGFSRPNRAGTSGTVEVHLLADHTMAFKSEPLSLPADVHLRNGRLVVVAPGPAATDNMAGGLSSVWSTTDFSRPLDDIGQTSGAVALSRDGTSLTSTGCSPDGDKLDCNWIQTVTPNFSWGRSIPAPATFVSVDSGPNSNFKATAWVAGAVDGTPYIGIETELGMKSPSGDQGVALTGMDHPMWICVQDDVLLWLSLDPTGSASLTRLDLKSVLQAA